MPLWRKTSIDKYHVRVKSGEIQLKKRKVQSDAGKSRKSAEEV
jgi:hypothetical protein